MSSRLPDLTASNEYVVRQRRELAELFGFETRNKYEVLAGPERIALAAEKGRGFGAALGRQFLGHFRTFELAMLSPTGELLLEAVHPFRWFFKELHVRSQDGRDLGHLQQRFGIVKRKFEVLGERGDIGSVSSPIWTPWTFKIERLGTEVARIEKKWSGLLKEAFTDADTFRVVFAQGALTTDERAVVLMAAIFVDLNYFEKKA